MKIGKNNLLYIMLGIGLIIFLFNIPIPKEYNVVLCVAIIVFIFILTTWFNICSIINYYTFFIISCFIFYFGQYMVYFFTGESIERWMSITKNYSPLQMNNSSIFVLRCLLFMHTAVLMFYKKNKINMQYVDKNEEIKLASNRMSAAIFFWGTYIPAMVIGIVKVRISSAISYSELYNYNVFIFGNPIDKIMRIMASFVIAAFIYVVIVFKDSKKMKLYLVLIGLYIIVYYMTGSRFKVTLFLCMSIIIRNEYYKKIDFKRILRLIPGSIFVLIIITSVGTVRANFTSYNTFKDLLKLMIDVAFKNNIFMSILSEFGMTAVVIATVLNYCPSQVSYLYGKSYLYAIMGIIPNFIQNSNVINSVNTDSVFHSYVNKYSGIGSSFIAEAYFNFGQGAYVIMFLLGLIIASVINIMHREIESKNYIKITMLYYFMCLLLFSVRSDLYSIVKELFYFYILIKVLNIFASRICIKRFCRNKSIS